MSEEVRLQSCLDHVKGARDDGAAHAPETAGGRKLKIRRMGVRLGGAGAYPPAIKCCHDFAGTQLLVDASGADIELVVWHKKSGAYSLPKFEFGGPQTRMI